MQGHAHPVLHIVCHQAGPPADNRHLSHISRRFGTPFPQAATPAHDFQVR
jgi:hypothetical protein